MHDGKWIDNLTAETPLAEAAQRVLSVRLGVVGRCLPPALQQSSEDVEHVHQLRVATRRARAALDIFAKCLTDEAFKAAKKQLRRIRRAAGAARDWDVFLADLTGTKRRWPPREAPGRDLLVGYALAQRGVAQQQLVNLGDDFPDRFERVEAEIVAGISTNIPQQSLLALGQSLLTELIQKLDTALAGDLDDYAKLHQVRIDGKRLRYAMEIFAGCFAPPFRARVYPVVEQMQEILGHANDSHVGLGHLRDLQTFLAYLPAAVKKRLQPGIESIRTFHEKRMARQRLAFAGWRQRWRRCQALDTISAV